jgi:hypothetical protein
VTLLPGCAGKLDHLARGQDERLGDADIDPDRRLQVRARLADLQLALNRDVPAIRLPADCGGFRPAFHWLVPDPLDPAGFRQEEASRLCPELLRVWVAEKLSRRPRLRNRGKLAQPSKKFLKARSRSLTAWHTG